MEQARKGPIVGAVLLAALTLVAAAAAAPPANDAFAGATLSGASGTAAGTTADATAEVDEPAGLGGVSVWYRWEAPSAGTYGFCTTPGASFREPDTVLGVWTGSEVGALTPVAFNDDGGWDSLGSFVSLEATAGTAYAIGVGGFDGSSGPFTLRWKAGECQPPDTSIEKAQVKGKKLQVWFSGADNVSPAADLSFECRLDAAAWAPCTSPALLTGSKGDHTAHVRATDAAGNVEAFPAQVTRSLKGPAAR